MTRSAHAHTEPSIQPVNDLSSVTLVPTLVVVRTSTLAPRPAEPAGHSALNGIMTRGMTIGSRIAEVRILTSVEHAFCRTAGSNTTSPRRVRFAQAGPQPVQQSVSDSPSETPATLVAGTTRVASQGSACGTPNVDWVVATGRA